MSNPRTQYNEYVRANLPSGMTFDSDLARYRYNDHSFASFWVANIYHQYIQKFGGGSDTTGPVINTFTIGSPVDDDYPITLDITEDSLPVTVYVGADLTSNGVLSDAAVISGTGVGFGNFSTSVDVVDTPVDLGPLADGDYTAKVVVVDSAGNSSSATDTFTVAGAAPVSINVISTDNGSGGAAGGNSNPFSFNLDLGAVTVGKRIYFFASGLFAQGVSPTIRVDNSVNAVPIGPQLNGSGNNEAIQAYYLDTDTIGGTTLVGLRDFTATHFQIGVYAVAVSGHTDETLGQNAGSGVASVDLPVVNGGLIIASGINGNGTNTTMVGAVEGFDYDIRSNEFFTGGLENGLSSEAARTISITNSNGADQLVAALSIE